jgi:hypothetical protein
VSTGTDAGRERGDGEIFSCSCYLGICILTDGSVFGRRRSSVPSHQIFEVTVSSSLIPILWLIHLTHFHLPLHLNLPLLLLPPLLLLLLLLPFLFPLPLLLLLRHCCFENVFVSSPSSQIPVPSSFSFQQLPWTFS